MTPKLRFKNYSGDWSQKTLGDIGEVRMCKRIFNSETTQSGDIPFYKIGTFGKSPDAFIDRELYEAYRNKYNFPKKGDVLISAAGTLGKRVRYNGEEAYFQDSNIVWIENNEDLVTNEFLYFLYEIVRYNSEGGTIQRLYNSIIKSAKIVVPSLDEQNKITLLLSSIEYKINLLNKKKKALESYKKGLMRKIFLQELKFKREDGTDYPEWSSSTIDELFVSKKGQGLSLSDITDDGAIKCLLYGSLYTKYNEVISECLEYTDNRGSVFAAINDLLVPASTTTSGIDLATFSSLQIDEVMIGGDVTVLTPINNQDSRWWAYYLSHHKKNEVAKYAQGSTIVHLYFKHFKKLNVEYPRIEEQNKIAEFLKCVDENVASLENQIKIQLKLKKGLLQQMFF